MHGTPTSCLLPGGARRLRWNQIVGSPRGRPFTEILRHLGVEAGAGCRLTGSPAVVTCAELVERLINDVWPRSLGCTTLKAQPLDLSSRWTSGSDPSEHESRLSPCRKNPKQLRRAGAEIVHRTASSIRVRSRPLAPGVRRSRPNGWPLRASNSLRSQPNQDFRSECRHMASSKRQSRRTGHALGLRTGSILGNSRRSSVTGETPASAASSNLRCPIRRSSRPGGQVRLPDQRGRLHIAGCTPSGQLATPGRGDHPQRAQRR